MLSQTTRVASAPSESSPPGGNAAVERIAAVAASYSNLEYEIDAGRRASRDAHAERLQARAVGGAGTGHASGDTRRDRQGTIARIDDHGHPARERPELLHGLLEGVDIDIGRGEHDRADAGVDVLRIAQLAQALERQEGTHRMRDDVDAADRRVGDERLQRLDEAVARPERAFAVIGVVEELAA